ncbi:MAG: hypothetical protein GY703_21555 [Gammaproteobacteria bacterium]|nr:hypothetical protein [Gammaproteobacteria bacterium]
MNHSIAILFNQAATRLHQYLARCADTGISYRQRRWQLIKEHIRQLRV